MDPVRLITQAISIGVPLFNGGDASGCAGVYSDAVVTLCQRVPSMSPLLHVALDKAVSTRSPADRAWVLRHVLDTVLREFQRGGSSTTARGCPLKVRAARGVLRPQQCWPRLCVLQNIRAHRKHLCDTKCIL